jgi:hypothetical protein
MRGRSSSIRRSVNDRETSLRSRVCPGGSISSIIGIIVAGAWSRSSGGSM